MPTALIFPGQGAPAPQWHAATLVLRPELVALATELAGDDPFERFGESTEFDQLAVYCASLAAHASTGERAADAYAGHSLGEISALVAAGALHPMDGVRLVATRGRLMARVCREGAPGGMLAVRAAASALGPVATRHGLTIANLNSPSQTVLSGPVGAIEAAAAQLRESGTVAKRLPVAGAFHSPQMAPAAAGFERALTAVDLRAPRAPVISGRSGRPFQAPRSELVAALTEPVRWAAVVERLARRGVERWIEVGPGKALGGLVRQTAPDARTETVPMPEPIVV